MAEKPFDLAEKRVTRPPPADPGESATMVPLSILDRIKALEQLHPGITNEFSRINDRLIEIEEAVGLEPRRS